MSSPAPETAKIAVQDSSPASTTPTQAQATEENISEETTQMKSSEKEGLVRPQMSAPNDQPELKDLSVEKNTPTDSKVTSTDNVNIEQSDLKTTEANITDSALGEKVHAEEPKQAVQETPGNNPEKPNAGETKKESNNEKNENVEIGAGKKTENANEEKIKTDNGDPSIVNENNNPVQGEPESGNSQENVDSDSSECINIQELTEHVMNILNDDGVVENVMSEQQLLKKNIDLQQFIVKLIHLLKEKTDLCANLDRQNSALISQAKSLKDVIAITKDLLGIRNMEIEHLHADMAAMEESIKEERNRHNLSVQRLNEAMSLNDKLKTEYLTQMDLFQKLREKYNEKVVYLTKENQRLNGLMNPEAEPTEANPNEINDQSNQTESVDK